MNDAVNPLSLFGLNVIQSEYLVEDGDPVTVRRSWRERLLTRPWRPWEATRTYRPKIPFRGALQLDARTVVMHPATYRTMCTIRQASRAYTGWDRGEAGH
jgi:hypothetical protein